MPDVSFKDLCIDVTELPGRPAVAAAFWSLASGQPVVPHDDGSFHLDPADGTPPDVTVGDADWWVLADPDGNELGAFEPR